jgi:hypothetical protein
LQDNEIPACIVLLQYLVNQLTTKICLIKSISLPPFEINLLPNALYFSGNELDAAATGSSACIH